MKIPHEKKSRSTTAALRAPSRPRQFFPKTTRIDIEAQKNLEQKKHPSLEINSLKRGDRPCKMGEIRPQKFEKHFFEKSMKNLKNQKF